MTEAGFGVSINSWKSRIQQLERDLESLESPEKMPEMIDSTNILRINEHLTATDQKKSEIIAAYKEYTAEIEKVFVFLLGIQNELKEILKYQSSMIPVKKKSARKSAKSSDTARRKRAKKGG